jgi:hypothetical protein
MDNLGAHHATGVRQAIEAKGASVLYMPPDSPDLHPIERCGSKFQDVLRTCGARTRLELRQAGASAAEFITRRDARGWFRHCGDRQPRASGSALRVRDKRPGEPEGHAHPRLALMLARPFSVRLAPAA